MAPPIHVYWRDLHALFGVLQPKQLRNLDPAIATITATRTLTTASRSVQLITPSGAAREVLLPAASTDSPVFYIVNVSASQDINVRNAANDATVRLLQPGQAGMFFSGATAYRGIVGLATASSAIADLTDSSGGTANDTVAAVSGSGVDADINNNFADLTAKINAILTALRANNIVAD